MTTLIGTYSLHSSSITNEKRIEVKKVNKKSLVVEKLADWITRVVDKKELATQEEIEALPKVAEVFFKNYSTSYFLPDKR